MITDFKKWALPIFLITAAAQLLVPAKMIWGSERVLREGALYRFKTRPIDPSDPFRGKFITLDYEANEFECDTLRIFIQNDFIFAQLSVDSMGFAKIDELKNEEPTESENYVKVRIDYSAKTIRGNRQRIDLKFPFDRLYMEESKASEAEQAYWQAAADSTQVAFALVKVKAGQGILMNVMINDRTIQDAVKEVRSKVGTR